MSNRLMKVRSIMMSTDLFMSEEYLKDLDAYWRAANYLAATQLYLLDNPMLRSLYP